MSASFSQSESNIAVVIPCYRVAKHILDVLSTIGPEVDAVYVVDDKCPENSGKLVEEHSTDKRVRVIYNAENRGVGGATLVGIEQARLDGADIVVKIDGDGQMAPAYIPFFCAPILAGEADYTKGNRFFEPESMASMPKGRILGNMGLSFMAKFSSGYWTMMDPTNGYFAIHTGVAGLLRTEKIAPRYFFESDLLFRLNLIGARVVDVPMDAYYGSEISNLSPVREIPRFFAGHLRNAVKRIFYNYFIRGFSLASLELVLGLVLLGFGGIFGVLNWSGDVPATPGTVMLAALPVIVGVQLLLSFVNFDINATPSTALHIRLGTTKVLNKPLTRRQTIRTADEKEVR